VAETAFLGQLAAFLQAAGLQPAPASIGASEPVAAAALPAIVLWLDEVRRLGGGLGERAALVTDGALPVTARIDLANPVLPEEPAFRLLSEDRLTLVLPHGGWVKADGLPGPLSSADLQVSVAGAARTVVNAAPAADQVRPDASIGTLLFGAPLPATGIVQATYVLGQWERRVVPIAGTLQIDVRATAAGDVEALSGAVIDALGGGTALPRGLRKIALARLSSIGAAVPGTLADSRGRSLRYTFEYDHEINRPDSSGGVIRRIPITTRLLATTVEEASGAIVTTVFSETEP
jgi:hypothetical protein